MDSISRNGDTPEAPGAAGVSRPGVPAVGSPAGGAPTVGAPAGGVPAGGAPAAATAAAPERAYAAEANRTGKVVLAVALVLAALVSFFPLGDLASSVETHAATINTIDDKKETVMGLVASSTGASVAVSFLPGDAGTPIAEKLVDISSDFMVVIAALYLEKYLLTILGFAAFKILVPLSCLLALIALLLHAESPVRSTLGKLAAKLALMGLAVFLVVPASVFVSDMIDRTYQESIAATVAAAQQTAHDIDEATGGADAAAKGDTNILEDIASKIQEIPGMATGLVDQAKDTLNGFIEALAVMVVTSCVIPVLVLLFFLWLVKVILGVDIPVPAGGLRPRFLRRRV